MIRSKTPRVYDAMSGDSAVIYANSTLQVRESDYIVVTKYFRRGTLGPDEIIHDIPVLVFNDIYTVAQVDGLFEYLRELLAGLPFTEMVKKAIEISLLDYLSNNVKFGIPVMSDGWEMYAE